MTAPKEVKRLVERFRENRDAYLSSAYNETQLRREFLDPFFKALGWDVDNEQGYAEAYKDVVHEDAIKVGGATKAPDYAFRIRDAQVLRRGEAPVGRNQGRSRRRVPAPPLRVVGEAPALDPDRLRGVRRL